MTFSPITRLPVTEGFDLDLKKTTKLYSHNKYIYPIYNLSFIT